MHEVTSRFLEVQPALVMRTKASVAGIPRFLATAYHAAATHAEKMGADIVAPPFARYRALDAEFTEFEIEAGFVIDRAVEGSDGVEASTLPAGPVATAWHIGPYETMKPTYAAVMAWIEEHGGAAVGPAWEMYHSDPDEEPDPATWRTEIFQPFTQ